MVGNQWVGIHAIWGMSAMGRLLPVTIVSPDRPLLGESSHSSKEFICSVRPSLNDRYRLEAGLPMKQA